MLLGKEEKKSFPCAFFLPYVTKTRQINTDEHYQPPSTNTHTQSVHTHSTDSTQLLSRNHVLKKTKNKTKNVYEVKRGIKCHFR